MKTNRPYSIRLPDVVREQLRKKAEQKGVTMYSYILNVLTKHAVK